MDSLLNKSPLSRQAESKRQASLVGAILVLLGVGTLVGGAGWVGYREGKIDGEADTLRRIDTDFPDALPK